jgi:hypothetical protein
MTFRERWGAVGLAAAVFGVAFVAKVVLNGLDERNIWPVDVETLDSLDWIIKMAAGSVLTVVGQSVRLPSSGTRPPP